MMYQKQFTTPRGQNPTDGLLQECYEGLIKYIKRSDRSVFNNSYRFLKFDNADEFYVYFIYHQEHFKNTYMLIYQYMNIVLGGGSVDWERAREYGLPNPIKELRELLTMFINERLGMDVGDIIKEFDISIR